MNPRNPYANNRPDFIQLGKAFPAFQKFLQYSNGRHYASIDFQNPDALRELTKTLLKHDFNLDVELPEDRLCPTLANRLDYILCVLDVALTRLSGISEQGKGLKVLDIGTGAIAIYAILLARLKPEADICATEIEPSSFDHARKTVASNGLSHIDVRLAKDHKPILQPLYELHEDDSPFTFTLCNPPFYESPEEMNAATAKKQAPPPAAPTAATNELITPGGEVAFVGQIIAESVDVKNSCKWFTSLIGKTSSITPLVRKLRTLKINNYFVTDIQQAETRRWIIGWSFTGVRLPDMHTQPRVYPPYILACFPPSHLFHWVAGENAPTTEELADMVDRLFINELHISVESDPTKNTLEKQGTTYSFRPRQNTWGRHARRRAQHGKLSNIESNTDSEPLFEVRIVVKPNSQIGSDVGEINTTWTWGHDREIVSAFCWFMDRKLSEACKALKGDEPASKRRRLSEGSLG